MTQGNNNSNKIIFSVLPKMSYNYLILKTKACNVTYADCASFGIITANGISQSDISSYFVARKLIGNITSDTPITWSLSTESINLEDKYLALTIVYSNFYLDITELYFTNEVPQ